MLADASHYDRRVPDVVDALLTAVTDLSFARDLPRVTEIVRKVARHLSGADGVTFVLKDAGDCYYADEDGVVCLGKDLEPRTQPTS